MQIGIVYDTVSGEVRRVIVPDSDEQLAVETFTTSDETLLRVARPDLPADTPDEMNKFVDAVVRTARSEIDR